MKKSLFKLAMAVFLSFAFIAAASADEDTGITTIQSELDSSVTAFDFTHSAGFFGMGTNNKGYCGLEFTGEITPKFALSGKVSAFLEKSMYDSNLYDFRYLVFMEGDWILNRNVINKYVAGQFYAWGLLGHTGEYETKGDYDYGTDTYSLTKATYSANVNAGAGLGFDFTFFNHLTLPLKIGFFGSVISDNYISFSASTGLSYRF